MGAFAPLDRRLGQLVNRWGFQAPDFRNAVRELGEALRRLYSEAEVTQTVERAVSQTLSLEDVRSIPLSRLPSGLWPAEIQQGEIIELDRCHALETTTENVRRYYPKWYRGRSPSTQEPA